MRDEKFAEAAQSAARLVPGDALTLGDGRQIVPRDFLHALATVAADWPHTPPQIWYGEIMQDCFWALTYQGPQMPQGQSEQDERDAAEGLTFGVLLAMMSADRGGHHAAADLCQTALAYMATLPAWRDVQIESNPKGQTSLTIDLKRHQSTTAEQSDGPQHS